MLGQPNYRPQRKQHVSACGNYIVMPDGSRYKRTVIPHPSKQVAKAPADVEQLLDEITNDDQ